MYEFYRTKQRLVGSDFLRGCLYLSLLPFISKTAKLIVMRFYDFKERFLDRFYKSAAFSDVMSKIVGILLSISIFLQLRPCGTCIGSARVEPLF